MSGETRRYLDGWYAEENDGHAFRWMSRESAWAPEAAGAAPAGGAWLVLTAGHPWTERPYPWLEVVADCVPVAAGEIAYAWRTYLFPLGERVPRRIELRLDKARAVPGEPRPLGIMVRRLDVVSPGSISEPLYGDGWLELEAGELLPFRWMTDRSLALLPATGPAPIPAYTSAASSSVSEPPPAPPSAPAPIPARRFLSIPVYSEFRDLSQELTVSLGGRPLTRVPLLKRWSFVSLDLRGAASFDLELRLNKLVPAGIHPGDPRPLGARIGPLALHDDEGRHAAALARHANALLNYREMLEGRAELRSFPTHLGIDLYGKCNIRPPCAYCLWERMKVMEGAHADDVVDEAALRAYGPYFENARTLVNCSFGEPLLHPRFGAILDLFARHDKILELSTNGQAFTERTISALAGRAVTLYVSLDAARAETYARIRNDRWDDVMAGLTRLHQARRKAGGLPKLYMVFMPMRVNAGDLEDYFALCRSIEADALVLRPLAHQMFPDIWIERGGYLFDYGKEMLPRGEVEAVIARAEALSRECGVPLANQFDFGRREDIDPKKSARRTGGAAASEREAGGSPRGDSNEAGGVAGGGEAGGAA